jgi:hypothetical protein
MTKSCPTTGGTLQTAVAEKAEDSDSEQGEAGWFGDDWVESQAVDSNWSEGIEATQQTLIPHPIAESRECRLHVRQTPRSPDPTFARPHVRQTPRRLAATGGP